MEDSLTLDLLSRLQCKYSTECFDAGGAGAVAAARKPAAGFAPLLPWDLQWRLSNETARFAAGGWFEAGGSRFDWRAEKGPNPAFSSRPGCQVACNAKGRIHLR
jgi:hypothetical protein